MSIRKEGKAGTGSRRKSLGARILAVRWLVRAPIGLYRSRLGFIFGSRLLMLEHIGRASGLPRYVVLEVVEHPSPNRYIVASGFGGRAQWYRNILANPHVRVTIGSRRPRAGVASVMSRSEVVKALATYRAEHPKSWEALKPVFSETLGEAVREDGSNLPLVSLELVE